MYAQPGKKLLFMGGEIGQWKEWDHEGGIDWALLDFPPHRGLKRWVEDLNRAYRREKALHALDFDPAGFEWIDCNDSQSSVLSFLRKGPTPEDSVAVICNYTPVTRFNYTMGVPRGGFWEEILNSDAKEYGGSGHGNMGGVEALPQPCHGRRHTLKFILPPLAVLFFRWRANPE
jgi:1,4-alpha-glucan branching enzyme